MVLLSSGRPAAGNDRVMLVYPTTVLVLCLVSLCILVYWLWIMLYQGSGYSVL